MAGLDGDNESLGTGSESSETEPVFTCVGTTGEAAGTDNAGAGADA